MGFFIIGVILVVLSAVSVIHIFPWLNWGFSLIWEDPSDVELRAIKKRLKELHIDGGVPEESAVLLAAKEYSRSEEELLNALGMLSASDVKGILTGKGNPLGIFTREIDKVIKRGSKKGGR